MADILIRGMEMPKSCGQCPMHHPLFHTQYCGILNKNCSPHNTMKKWCPLIQLPEGHGRLIDADALKDIIGKFSLCWEYGQGVSDCFAALVSAPTIIEAEGDF